jgi:hypothetical protein
MYNEPVDPNKKGREGGRGVKGGRRGGGGRGGGGERKKFEIPRQQTKSPRRAKRPAAQPGGLFSASERHFGLFDLTLLAL